MRFQLRSTRVLFSALLLLALMFVISNFSPLAHAAGIVVDSTADDTLANLDANTTCDLREAITNANNNAATYPDCAAGAVGLDTITFGVSGTITLTSTLPAISDDLTIDGTGQTITVDGANTYQVLKVNSGKTVTINALTIANGNAPGFYGGGIYSLGSLTVTNSTIRNSSAGLQGGGIYSSSLIVTNSTIVSNSAGQDGGGLSAGSTMIVTNSTIFGNTAPLNGSGVYVGAGSITLHNSIVAGNTLAGQCGYGLGTIFANTYNLDSDGSCGGATTSGSINLAALANNGGPTWTMKLQSPSDALNTGDNTVCDDAPPGPNNLDQRGAIRPQNTTCDVGAYELLYCAAGSYDNGSASCAPAPMGYFVAVDGAVAASPCNPGYYQDQTGQTSCKQADPGYYVPVMASSVQTACPAGSTSAAAAIVCYQTGPSFVVNDASDTDDSACDALPGDCTLREAINAANALTGADTITFDIPDDAGALCSANNICTITLSALNTLPAINDDVKIDGAPNNGNITVSGASLYRVMYVNSGKTLGLNALTIANGYVFSGFAGGIWNYGTLNVTNSTFNTNYASSGGGGILNEGGTVNIIGSTFSGNNGGSGGALYNLGGTYNIANSTFSGNFANNGGVLFNFDTAANITNSTFSGNYANNGGVVFNNSGTLNLKNSILTNTSNGGDCDNSGTITGSDNLIDDTTCGSGSPFRLGAVTDFDTTLANNGGPTQTFKLNSNSNAINAVPSGECTYVSSGTNPLFGNGAAITADQRGETRPQGLFCDIGAYELVYTGFQTPPNFVVNSAADTNDNSCDTLGQGIGNKDCTLREAINAANANTPVADTITFDIPDGGACSPANTCTITLGSILPTITDDVTIDGAPNNGNITVSGNNSVSILYNDGATTVLESLTLTKGGCCSAVDNAGVMRINNSTISDSTSLSGGAVFNTGDLTLTNSTFFGNTSTLSGGGGGVVFNKGGNLTVANSTFKGNSAANLGGVILNNGTLTLTNSTLSDNTAGAGSGGGIYNNGATVALYNTIIANSTAGGDCVNSGGTVTGNNNLIEGSSNACGFTNGTNGNLIGVDPNLGSLANNGGRTQTMALSNLSVAIDAGDKNVCAATVGSPNFGAGGLDQRGKARNDLQCDIGAFEFVDTDGNTISKAWTTNGTHFTFGPTLADMLLNSGSPLTLVVKRVLTAPNPSPNLPAGALPITWDATTKESPFSLRVILCYDPVTYPVDPNTLHVWHFNGSTWEDLGGTSDTSHAPYACVKAMLDLTTLSPLALAPGAPTATNVTGVKGLVNKNGKIALRWKTTTETQIAGFNIYRQGKQGVWKQVNAKFRQAKHAGSALGDTYRFVDRKANATKMQRYKIEIVYLDGHSEWTKVIRVAPR